MVEEEAGGMPAKYFCAGRDLVASLSMADDMTVEFTILGNVVKISKRI